MKVDLNCDLGEEMGDDAAMLRLASSVNIACGYHAGGPEVMFATAVAAKQRGVAIGAHPSYFDRAGFGRTPRPGLSASNIEALVAYQIGALQSIAALAGHRVTHVKAHGALSNAACADETIAKAIAAAIKAVDRDLHFLVLPHTAMARASEDAGLPTINEIYADRAYEDDAQLVSRSKPGAVLHDASVIAERVLQMVQEQSIVTQSGRRIKTPIDTICIHGDTPGAVDIAQRVRNALEASGVGIAPFNLQR